jgi:hypothetical protein
MPKEESEAELAPEWKDFLKSIGPVDDETRREYISSLASEDSGMPAQKQKMLTALRDELIAADIYEQGGDLAKDQGKRDQVDGLYKNALRTYKRLGFTGFAEKVRRKMINQP